LYVAGLAWAPLRTLLTNNVDLTVVPEPNVKKQPSAASQPFFLACLAALELDGVALEEI
jgi:hypothetical protein